MLADRVKCAVPNPGPVDVGSTVTLGAARPGFRSFLVAFGALMPAFFVLSDGAGRTITGIWTVNASVPETATITEILGNDRTGDTSGETFAGDCIAWCAVPARETRLIRSGPLAGLRNLIINGAFAINQRSYVSGAATTGANQYTLDRWRVVASGQSLSWTDSAGVRTVTFPAGGAEQVVEGSSIRGGIYTASWPGSATCTVNGVAVANGGQVSLPGGANATVRLSGGTAEYFQLEPGPIATPFEMRPLSLETLLCLRYLRVLGSDVSIRFYSQSIMSSQRPLPFSPPMRATPTATPIWTGANGNAGSYSIISLTNRGAQADLVALATGDTYVTLTAATSFSAEL